MVESNKTICFFVKERRRKILGIHDGHRDRLKNQFLANGLKGMPMHNALELLLYFAIPLRDTNPIAHELLSTFGDSVSSVFDADFNKLKKVEGIGENSALLIKLIPELMRVYIEDKNEPSKYLNTTAKQVAFLRPKFFGRMNETVILLSMDGKGKPMGFEVLNEGGPVSVSIMISKVIKSAVIYGASHVVLAHNHPHGFVVPSNEDMIATTDIFNHLLSIEVELSDHIIITDTDYYSFAANQKLPRKY